MLALALVAAASSFSAQAQNESETTVVEVYKSDMTNWTFEEGTGAEKWQVISTGDSYLDGLTTAEKEKTGCDDGIGIKFDDDNDTNSWAVSPAVKLNGNTKYTVSLYVKAASNGDPESYKVVAAKESSLDALNAASALIEQLDYSTYAFMEHSAEFTPEADGDYYFGLNCFSAAGNYGMYATGFTISYEQTSGVSVVVADENGAMEYFDLQGRKVETPSNGLYICRQGDKVKKVVVK